MARSGSIVLSLLALAALVVVPFNCFVGAPRVPMEIDARSAAAVVMGLAPLALEQPASAYDSVVAMLQSWLVGGTVLTVIFAAAIIAAAANPLTKRRQEVQNMMNKK
mmetsp:Transcript_132805/g.425044  ORF Transcript_132805/g.425044 Transcript_132805/m.425044 type:complete len:107 (-) Transcript_132805:133-453(-)